MSRDILVNFSLSTIIDLKITILHEIALNGPNLAMKAFHARELRANLIEILEIRQNSVFGTEVVSID